MQNKNFNKQKRYNNNNGRSQNFDSSGPNGSIKGSAKQISEKYSTMAREAYSNGDNILMENLNQHAEHYFRINNYLNDQAEQKKKARNEYIKTAENKEKEALKDTENEKKEAIDQNDDIKIEEKISEKTKRKVTRKRRIGSKTETNNSAKPDIQVEKE